MIFFSDILVPAEAMGAKVEFGDAGPSLPDPVRSAADVARLARFDPSERIPYTGAILRRLAREVGDRAAILGFCGAPWTLASYLVEGGGSKSFAVIKAMMTRDPSALRRLLDLAADVASDVLSYQIASGADAVQLFDTWAGELSADDYREWALPAAARAIAGIRRDVEPVILYVNGSNHLLESMAYSGADVLSVDWRTSLADARRRLPGKPAPGQPRPGRSRRNARRRRPADARDARADGRRRARRQPRPRHPAERPDRVRRGVRRHGADGAGALGRRRGGRGMKPAEVSLDLLRRYNVPGPRYTSYPTAPAWKETYGASDYAAILAEARRPAPRRSLSTSISPSARSSATSAAAPSSSRARATDPSTRTSRPSGARSIGSRTAPAPAGASCSSTGAAGPRRI